MKFFLAVLLNVRILPVSHVMQPDSYRQYAFIDISVSAESAAPLFDALTSDMRQTGRINLDDPTTALANGAYGHANPARLAFQYINKDGSMVSLSIVKPERQTFIKTPYDPTVTYVVLSLGYSSVGVADLIVSSKIGELVHQVRYHCDAAKLNCSIRARLQDRKF